MVKLFPLTKSKYLRYGGGLASILTKFQHFKQCEVSKWHFDVEVISIEWERTPSASKTFINSGVTHNHCLFIC